MSTEGTKALVFIRNAIGCCVVLCDKHRDKGKKRRRIRFFFLFLLLSLLEGKLYNKSSSTYMNARYWEAISLWPSLSTAMVGAAKQFESV